MNIQYIEDKDGKLTGVFVPIEDWEKISKKAGIEDDVPEWQKEIVRERMKNYDPSKNVDAFEFLDELKTKNELQAESH